MLPALCLEPMRLSRQGNWIESRLADWLNCVQDTGIFRVSIVFNVHARSVTMFVGDDDALGGFGPATVVADAAVGADGADDAVGGGCDRLRLLHQEFEAAAGAGGAFFEQAVSAGVSVNGAALAEAVFVGEEGGALPVKETLLDGLAVGVVTDGAARRVVAETDFLLTAGGSETRPYAPVKFGRRFRIRASILSSCGAFLKCDHDGKRKLDLSVLKIFQIGWFRGF